MAALLERFDSFEKRSQETEAASQKRIAELEEALAKKDEELAKASQPAAKPVAAKPGKPVTELFGNLDKKKEFNLLTIKGWPNDTTGNPLSTIPDGLVIIVKQSFVQGQEDKIEDTKARMVQFIEPLTFDDHSKVQKGQSMSAYEVTGLTFTLVHDPRK